MKKIVIFIAIGSFFFGFSSCDKIFLGVEGKEADLQGKWQTDISDSVFYNFQNSLFEYQIYRNDKDISQIFGYYVMHGDTTIDLSLLLKYAWFTPTPLDYLGWDTILSPKEGDMLFKTFKIDKLTSKKLILSSDGKVVSLHKF